MSNLFTPSIPQVLLFENNKMSQVPAVLENIDHFGIDKGFAFAPCALYFGLLPTFLSQIHLGKKRSKYGKQKKKSNVKTTLTTFTLAFCLVYRINSRYHVCCNSECTKAVFTPCFKIIDIVENFYRGVNRDT